MLTSLSGGVAPIETSSDASGTSTDDGASATASSSDDGGATSSSGVDTDVTGDPTTGTTTTAEPQGGLCGASPSDAPCTACSKTSCCAELQACSTDEDCMCFMTCVYGSGDVFGCGTECAVDLFAPGPVGSLVACSAGPCASACA